MLTFAQSHPGFTLTSIKPNNFMIDQDATFLWVQGKDQKTHDFRVLTMKHFFAMCPWSQFHLLFAMINRFKIDLMLLQ